jgi:hypothetical protein
MRRKPGFSPGAESGDLDRRVEIRVAMLLDDTVETCRGVCVSMAATQYLVAIRMASHLTV